MVILVRKQQEAKGGMHCKSQLSSSASASFRREKRPKSHCTDRERAAQRQDHGAARAVDADAVRRTLHVVLVCSVHERLLQPGAAIITIITKGLSTIITIITITAVAGVAVVVARAAWRGQA